MKKLFAVLISSILILMGVSGIAIASPMTWTDTIDFIPDVLVPPTLHYTHDISDAGFASLLMGGNDWLDSYELTVSIRDDGGNNFWKALIDGSESATIWTLGGIYSYDFTLSSDTFEGNLLGVLDIWADGKMGVTITSGLGFGTGDFYVNSSTLSAHGDDGAAPVPEPATMLLLGAGLVGLAGFSKRKLKD